MQKTGTVTPEGTPEFFKKRRSQERVGPPRCSWRGLCEKGSSCWRKCGRNKPEKERSIFDELEDGALSAALLDVNKIWDISDSSDDDEDTHGRRQSC